MSKIDPDQLVRLIDENEIEQLLALVSIDEIAEAWWRYMLDPASDQDWDGHPDSWPSQFYFALLHNADRENVMRSLLAALGRHAPAGDDVTHLGAGPLEDFISDGTDEERIRWVEEEAARSVGFRRSLAWVWIDGDVTKAVFDRIQNAAGSPLPRKQSSNGRKFGRPTSGHS